MNNKTRQILPIIFLFILVIFSKSTYVCATTDLEIQQQVFKTFKETEFRTSYTMILGEQMSVTPNGSRYIDIVVKSSNKDVVDVSEDYLLKGIKNGESTITIIAKFYDETVQKEFKIKVETTKESTELDSSTNDVVSIKSISKKKTQILLANNELWDTSDTTFKLSNKEKGNVSTYVYTRIYSTNYAKDFDYDKDTLTALLKNDNTLVLDNFDQTFKVSNVKQISYKGYLNEDGEYFQYIISKDAKLESEKVLDDVISLIGNGLVVKKDGKTYTTSGMKVFDFKAIATTEDSSEFYGYVLNSRGELHSYSYEYEYNYQKFMYVTKKMANNVKCFINNYSYKTKSGDTKPLNDYSFIDCSIKKQVYIYNNSTDNMLTLKLNNKLYLNDKTILNNVEDICYVNGTKGNVALIVRKDGSVWRINLNGNSSLVKVRNGKDSNKKITKPTKLIASKSGKNNIKLKWNKVEGASKYTIYRSTSKDGTYKKIGTSKTNTYINKKVNIGKTYFYKVVANHSNSNYNSSRSSYVKIKIPKVPKKFKATRKSKSSIKVTFNKVSGVAGYEIMYSTDKDFKKYSTKTTIKNSYTLKKLKKNKTYYIKVKSYQTINNKKVYSSSTSKLKVKLK